MIVNPTFPTGFVTFCDDIRHEVTGKMTLVGVYHGEMDITGDSPAPLMGFNILVDFRFLKGSLQHDPVFKVFRSDLDEPILETTVERPITLEGESSMDIEIEPGSVVFDSLVFTIPLNGLIIYQPCFVRVRAFVGEIECRLGSLRINLWPPARDNAAT